MEEQDDSSLNYMEPRFVNKGLRAPAFCPNDPQVYLHRSNHPYAPFVGNALTWESWVFDDGTSYEGLCREDIPHGKGVMIMGNGSGGGFQETSKGDTYEGEFYTGFAHGLGQYVSQKNKEVYRGEFYAGKRQGCGVVMNFKPFHDLVKRGVNPDKAWKKTKEKILARARYGTWRKDFYVAGPDEQGQRYCHMDEIKGTLEEISSVLTQARMFQWKPDGEATYIYAQDGNGMPLNLLQDPLHYPYGTKFLAPGPLGQCHNCPSDKALEREMLRHATNYQRIHDMYNLDYDPPPGSNLYNAIVLAEKRRLAEEMVEEENAAKTASARLGALPQKLKDADDSSSSDESPSMTPASLTMGLAKRFGKALKFVENGVDSFCQNRARLARPLRASAKRH